MQNFFRTPLTRALAFCGSACLLAIFIAGTTDAGIQGSGFRTYVYGRITGFGSVVVNGVEYGTANARISANEHPASQSALRIGQIVAITGTVNADGSTGTADEVTFAADARGPVAAFDSGTRSFSVRGQRVRMTEDTLSDVSAIQNGVAVEVSGFRNSAGDLVASRVDLEPDANAAQVRGAIAALDANAHTFMLNTLLVDYEGAVIEGALAEGAVVVAQGTSSGSATLLTASRVHVSPNAAAQGGQGDLEGIVTSFASAAEFTVNGQPVVADERTRYVLRGQTLQADATVNVTGRFQNGVLLADKVKLERAKPAQAKPAQTKGK
jgi:hypothetical protein